MSPAAGDLKEFLRIAHAARRRAVAQSSPRHSAWRVSVSRSALAAFLALIALSLAATANAQIPPETILAGQSPNAVAVNSVTNKIYIANSGSNDVTVVDGATNTVSTINDTHATSPVAIAVNSLTNMVYVANSGSNNVSVFSGATGSTPAAYVTTITNGNGLGPSAIAVDANLNQVYATNSTSGNVSVINGATNAITATVFSGPGPSAVAVNSATGFFYVVNAGDNSVAIFNGNTNTIAGSASMGSNANPFAVGVNEATDQIYVSNNGTNNVIQIDGGTQAITGSPISNGNAIGLQGIAINPVTNQIFVAANSGNTLVINGAGNSTAIVNDPNASGGIGVTVDSITDTVYVANFNGTVTEFNGGNLGGTIFNFATGGNTQAIVVNPVTHRAYAACALNSGAFTVIDGASLTPTTISSTDSAPSAIVVNPATNLIYVANAGDNDVTVINGATNTIQGTAIGVGNTPTAMAIDPIRNQIYVLNSGDDFITDIDGASGQTAPITDGDASGLTSITFNPVTNTGFFVGATSQTLTTFSTIFGVNTTTSDLSLTGFAPHPGPIAINPSNGELFILDNFDNTYTVLDAVTHNSVTNGGTLGGFTAVAINPVTNFAYVATPDGVLVVNGSGLGSDTVADVNAVGPSAIAVNPVSNLVYVANGTSNNVSVFKGATGTSAASYVTTVFDSFASNPQAIAVNPATNKIYVVNSGSHTVTVIDGVTNGELSIPVGNNPVAAGVNPITNEGYIVNRDVSTVTAIVENQPQTDNIQTNITPLSGNASSTTTPTFTFSATNELSEKTPPPSTTFAPIAQIYYQVDTLQGTWTPTKTQSGFSATLAPLTPGVHTLYAFATDGEDSTSTISGVQSGPTVGTIASYQFLVASEIGQFFTLFGNTQDFGSQSVGVASAAMPVTLENEGGFPMNFTFNLSGGQAADFHEVTGNGTLCSSLGGLLPANSSCVIYYQFQPSATGPESAQVQAFDTTSGTPVAIPPFNLTGTGASSQQQLTVNISGTGTVSDNLGQITNCSGPTCTGSYSNGASVILTATPHAGSSFTGWSGDCSGTGTCSLTMNQSHSVTATFNGSGPTLTIGEPGTGLGTVTTDPSGISCQPNCSATFATDSVVTLVATPAAGSAFTGWSGACTGTGPCQVTMHGNQAVTASFTLTAATACPATANKVWTGLGGNNNWSTPGNWSPNGVPASGAVVCIANGASGTHAVIGDINTSTGGLYVDAGNSLSLNPNVTFTVAGTVFNAGTITLNIMDGNNIVLTFSGTVTLTGGGTLTLSKGGGGTPILNNSNFGALTNVNNTIQGAGQFGNNGLVLTNQAAGKIIANDANSSPLLLVNVNNVVNQGLMEATGKGVLQISVAIVNQGANIQATGSNGIVQLVNGATIRGGTVTISSPGVFKTLQSNGATLDGSSNGALTIVGTYEEELNSTTILSGTIINTGILKLDVTDGNNVVLQFSGTVTLTGGGTVTMSQGGPGTPILNNSNFGALINVNNTIQGAGQIGNNGLVLTNQAAGKIIANDANSKTLFLIAVNNVLNQGLIEATGNGLLQISVAIVNQGANIESVGSAATVQLVNGSTIRGGTLTNGGGVFKTLQSSSTTLDGSSNGSLTIVGLYEEELNSTTVLVGTIFNTGTLKMDVSDSNNVVLNFSGVVTLTGGGTVLMAETGGGTAVLNNSNFGQLINVNNLIEGAGQIGNNGLVFTNQAAGVVNANDSTGKTLLINANNVLNQGLIEATGKGVLEINVAIANQGANIEAIGSTATVEMVSGSTIRGGTLTNSGGLWETLASTSTTYDGSTLGQINLIGTFTGQVNSTTILVGTVNNTGTIFLDCPDSNNTVLDFSGTVTLTGGGTVTMHQAAGGVPILNNSNFGQLINVNNLIQGAGQIGNNGLVFTNQAAGVVNANDPAGKTLLVNSNNTVNQGLIESTGHGVLTINVAIVNQGATIGALANTATFLCPSGITIRGGTLINNGGTMQVPASTQCTLDGATDGPLTLKGTLVGEINSTTQLIGTIINNGNIVLTVLDSNNTVLNFSGVVTLTGGGTITLSKGGTGTPILNNSNFGQLVNVNNLIQGAGQIGNNGLVVTNQAGGVINANLPGATLVINPSGTFMNQGLVESTGTGVLQISVAFDNAGAVFPNGSPSPGSIGQSGSYTQEATGALDVIIGGTDPSQISFYGTNNGASLNGALNIVFANGFSPSLGQTFRVFGADVINGTFSSINSPALAPGLGWSIAYTDNAILTVVSVANNSQTLTVSDLGTGSGHVTDDLEQISCVDTAGVVTGSCSHAYTTNSIVNVTATADGSSTFAGWGGACSGTGACSVTMGSAQSVTASFVPNPTSINLNFTPSTTPQTQMATFNCLSNPNPTPANPCTDPNAHALALTVAAVNAPFTVTVLATEIPPTQADGNCENGNDVNNDFDCRFVTFFPGATVTSGRIEPLCDPYSAGHCVHYNIFSGTPGNEPPVSAYNGPVNWKITWNNDTFVPPSPTYQPIPRLFDDPDYGISETSPYGTNCSTPMLVGITNPQPTSDPALFCQFEFDITTSFDASEPVDSGIGGTTRQFNDVVVAFPTTVASPNLSASKTADAASVNIGATVGFTIATSNSTAGGTAAANNVALNDALPGGAGTNWSISPAFTGPGTCSISGAVGAQVLHCSFGNLAPGIGASVHVSSSTTDNGTLANTATITADNNATLTSSATISVGNAAFSPVFSNLTPSQSIAAGTPSINLSGILSAGNNFPPAGEIVSVTINGSVANTTIGESGVFSITFPTSSIPASNLPYPIIYSYAGDANFNGATDSSTSLTVTGSTQSFALTVTLLGTGIGTVTDDLEAINCTESAGVESGTCTFEFTSGQPITLTAGPTAPSTFIGWGGACAGSGTSPTCHLTVDDPLTVTANFLPPPRKVDVTFDPGTNVAQMATFNCPNNANPTPENPCTDPNAHAVQLMIPTVLQQFTVTVQATEVPPGQADGDCSPGNTVNNDFDCRFTQFFSFGTAGDGGKLVPLCDPYANGNCVHYLVFAGSPGNEPPPEDYVGGVQWLVTWNFDTFVPPSIYATPPRFYDDPDYAVTPLSAVGTDCSQPMTVNGTPQSFNCQFEYDITTQFFSGKKVDSGIGGTTRQFNDVVVAFPPANVPQLQAASAPDNATVTPGNPIGFTVMVINSGTGTANNVTVNDPLPSGTGVNWSLNPLDPNCAINGAAPNQVLSCTYATVPANTTINIHVTSAVAAAGTYTNTAVIIINGQQLLTIATLTVTAPTTTAFSNLAPSQTITFGTASVPVFGTISAGGQFPPTTESVTVTINGAAVTAPIGANGTFSATFPTATIPASTTLYPITYSYAGDTNFAAATDSSTSLTVNKANQTISLTGAPASAAFGSTFTISATATSGLSVTVVATGGCSLSGNTVTMTSGTTTCTLTANQAGNTNFNAAPQVVTTTTATKAASSTTITANSPNPSSAGQPVSVSFKVSGTGGTPTGSVTVTATLSATTVTCSATLSAGVGSCSVTLNSAGTWTLTAAYAGDNNFTSSTSTGVSQTVNTAVSTLKFTPAALDFGTLYVGQTQFKTLTLTNTDGHMITFTNFNIASVPGADSNGFFGVSFCPRTLNPGRSCTIIMGFFADSNVTRPHAATLAVTDNAPLSPQTVPLTATVINPIGRLSTGNLSFGNQNKGTTSNPKTVMLSNAGTTPLVVSNISISGDFAFAAGTTCGNGQTLAPGASCAMNVTFTPSSKGQRSGFIKIVDNALNSPQFVSLSGNGK